MNTLLNKILLIAILACSSIGMAFAQTILTGTVTDDMGPLEGVNVIAKGTTAGTTTNDKGEFRISAVQGTVLLFSYIGYTDQEVTVGKSNKINILMVEDSQQLDALVVVGYGMQRRKDITGSVASVKMEDLNYTPGSDPADLLRGRIAGVEITSTSGRPGSTSDIKIRGSRSLTGGNSPLFVIDGSPATSEEFGMLNGSEIASIEVLKDAASQAIYGTRAANGVILVSTNRGKADRVRVSLNAYGSVQTLWRNFDFYDGEEFYNLRREALAGDNMFYDPDQYEMLVPSYVLNDYIMEEVYENKQFTDWEKLMLKPAMAHKYDLSISGGNDKLRVAAGFGYYGQNGMVTTGSKYRRGTARLNIDYNVYKWLTLGVNASFAKSFQDREYGSFSDYITRVPIANPFNEDGSPAMYINSKKDKNPLYSAQFFERNVNKDNFRINTFFDIKPFKGFSYRLNVSYYNSFSEDGQYTSSKDIGSTGAGSLSNSKYENILVENILNYAVPIKNMDHRLNLTAVQSYDYTLSKSMSYKANNMPIDMDWNFLPNGEVTDTGRGYSEETMISFMGRIQYSFKDRYLFTVAVRHDGDSKFGANNKWATFPSVSAGWLISEEPWMKSASDAVNNLKLRASWGQVGSHSGLGRYKSLGLANGYEMEFGDRYQMGYMPGSELSNPSIGWETTSQTNVGVDFGFFDNRLSGSIEYYNTYTKDLLVKRSISNSLGYTTITDNMGATSTWGTEISLSGDIVRKNGILWSVGTNFSLYRNKILKINGLKDENGKEVDDKNNSWFIGHPLSVYYDYQFDGIYQFEDFDFDGSKYTLKPTYDKDGDGIPETALSRDSEIYPGAIKVRDVNKDGKIDADDKVIIPKDPKFTMSLNTTFKWKGFDLYADFYAVYGRVIQNRFLYEYTSGGSLQGALNGVKVNYWTPQNPSDEYPRPRSSQGISYHSSLSYQDASYFRLRTLTLGYTLPSRITKKAKIDKLRFYVTGTNIFTLTRFLSYSPELTPGAYPESRQWVFGLNLNF